MIVWPLTQGWCDDVMTGHARVTVTWHPVTRTQCCHEYTLAVTVHQRYIRCCELSQEPHDSLVLVMPSVSRPGPLSSGGHWGAKVITRWWCPGHCTGGNWCLAWYVHTHNGAIHDGEILSRDGSAQQLTIIGLSSPFHNLTVSRHWYGDG